LPDDSQTETVMAQLERILKSPALMTSPSLCRFLRYIVEETLAGHKGSIKEYSLGVNVFGRGDDFNPRLDPIVRVQARNLRSRIDRYYAGEGAADPMVIELPKGAYVPVFRAVQQLTPPAVGREAVAREAVGREMAGAAVEIIAAAETIAAVQTIDASAGARLPDPARGHLWPRSALIVAAVLVLLLAIAVLVLTHTHAAPSGLAHVPDALAQDLYIRGRYVMDRQTEPALRESALNFQQAVDRDPAFAAAYAGAADAYNLLSQFGYMPPREGMEKARTLAMQALAIAPAMAEGHVSLAAILEAYDWDWAGAEREYRRALELNPGLAGAHLWYGMFLRDQGRLQEALPELRRAAQLEPFSALTSVNLAFGLLAEGNYSAALEQARRAVELAPGLAAAQVMLAHAYRGASNTAEAEAVLARALQSAPGNPHALSILACELVRLGRRDESLALFHELDRLSKTRYVSPYDLGRVSLLLGDEERGLSLFEEAYRQRSTGLIFLRDAKFAGLRDTPRFQLLLNKLHFKG
jgi:tetratricopeptide (TPR) repeat protein